jgi:hypothetical protein
MNRSSAFKSWYRFSHSIAALLILLSASMQLGIAPQSAAQQSSAQATTVQSAPAQQLYKLYIPAISSSWQSPFGIQSLANLTSNQLLARAAELRAGWARLGRISWRDLQPNEGDAIQWSQLAGFENELRALRAAGIMPEVVVYDSPRWATINTPHPTSCGAIRADKFGAFAQFMAELAARYSSAEFGVKYWELGNEIDVDPRLVVPDSEFGCWGDIDDPFYGGRHYGEMLKVVTPAIRAANPSAQVWLGGLLLSSPNTTNPQLGKPERFLAGVLEAGAAAYFDKVPYHWYTSYTQKRIDYDNAGGGPWDALGGGVIGKAQYLRTLMQGYGVNKPLFLNETSFACPNDSVGGYPWCVTPAPEFFDMQADMLVRMWSRGLSIGVDGFIWYTLDAPGWRNGALLNADGSGKPVYFAYKQLSTQLYGKFYDGPASFGNTIEGYRFRRGTLQVQVLWAKLDQIVPIQIPASTFVGAYTRDGQILAPTSISDQLEFQVTFQPIYIIQQF